MQWETTTRNYAVREDTGNYAVREDTGNLTMQWGTDTRYYAVRETSTGDYAMRDGHWYENLCRYYAVQKLSFLLAYKKSV